MKKFLISVLSVVAGLSAVLGFASCSGEKKSGELLDVNLPDYEFVYNPEFEDDYASDMKIDGVIDESKWENQNWLTHAERGVKVKYTTIFDEYGVYLAGVAEDPRISYYGRFDMLNNSGFSIYATREEVRKDHHTDVVRMELDAYDRRSYYQSRFAGQAKVNGDIDAGEATVMTMELFVSWKNLHIDTTDGIPERVKIEPVYRQVVKNDEKSRSRYNIYPTFTEPTFISLYPYFGKTGYLGADQDGELLGAGGNGVAATDGWDLSNLENGTVKTTRHDSQAIFFKDIQSENFVAKTTVKPIGALSNSSPKFGMIASKSFDYFRAIYVDGNSAFKKTNLTVSALTYYPGRRFQETSSVYKEIGYSGFNDEGTFKLEYVKYGTLILFFVNDELVYSDTKSWYDGIYAPGLYTLGCEAEFSAFSAEEKTDEAVQEYIVSKGVSCIDVKTSAGGSASVPTSAVKAGEKIVLTISPTLGYAVSSVKINGEERFEHFCETVQNGTYEYPTLPIAGVETVEVQFTMFADEDTNRDAPIWGKLVSSQNNKVGVGNATIKVQSSYPYLYYLDSAGTTGDYYFDYLPVEGATIATIGGKEVKADGKYTVTFTSGVYRPLVKKYEVTRTTPEKEENLIIENRVLGGNVSTSTDLFESDSTGWDLSKEAEKRVVAGKGSGSKVLYFSGTTSKKAVLDFTAADCTPVDTGYDLEPGMGFVIANENITLGVILVGGNIRVLPKLDWNISTLHSSGGVFHTSNNKNTFYKVKVVHNGDLLAILVAADGTEDYKLVYAERMAELDAVSAYGLVSTSAGTPNVVFKNYNLDTTDSVNTDVTDKYLRYALSIQTPETGTLTVVDKDTGEEVENGKKLIAGGLLDVKAVAPNGYFVYAVSYNGKNVRLSYNHNASIATCQLTFANGGEISATFLPTSEKGKDILFTMSPKTNEAGNAVSADKQISGLNLVQYSTKDGVSSADAKALEQFVTVMFTPTVSDFTAFKYLDFEIYEENSNARILPGLWDADGTFYSIGGANKSTLSGTRTDSSGSVTTRSADGDWQGVSVAGNGYTTYRFASDAANIAKYATLSISGNDGSLSLSSVKNVSVAIYAYKYHRYTVSFGDIYGVKADGVRVKIFDAASAKILATGTQDSTKLANDVQIYYFELNKPAASVCYQLLTKFTNKTITASEENGSMWEIIDKGNGYQFVWQKAVNTQSQEKYLNLALYDAISFKLDTTQMSEGKELSAEIAMFTGTDISKLDCRPYYAYAISGDGSVQKLGDGVGVCKLPAGFKGTIIVLFSDFTKNRTLSDKENVYNYFNIITDVKGMGGEKFKISEIKIISNGKKTVEEAVKAWENQAK